MGKKPLYYWLPEWAQNAAKRRKCIKCNINYKKQGIVAVGMRETEENNTAMYIEHICSECSYRSITILSKQKAETLEGMCFALLESIKKKKVLKKSGIYRNKNELENMTDKEVDTFIKFVKKTSSHADFLKEIGVHLPDNKKDKNDTS